LWQDVAAVLTFALLDYIVRFNWLRWALYSLAIVYIAINVAVVRVLFSPLTLPMIRAARGPLADSMTHYLTAKNVGAMAAGVFVVVILPIALARWRPRNRNGVFASVCLSVAFVALGPTAVSKVDTAGRYRNAFGALWPAHIAPSAGDKQDRNWRTSPFPIG